MIKNAHKLSDEQLLDALPPPPGEVCSDRTIIEWLRTIGEEGGWRALRLVFASGKHWPFSPQQRSAVWSTAHRLMDEAMQAEKAAEEARQKKIRDKVAKRTSGKWWDRQHV